MNDLVTLAVAIVPGATAAWFAYRSATKAHAVESSKVDGAAYDRAKLIYESALQTLEDQLIEEREGAAALRTEVRAVRRQVQSLQSQVSLLIRQVRDAGLVPVTIPEEGP
jgi:hypothetical protein